MYNNQIQQGFCPRCGSPVRQQQKFCTKCGNNLISAVSYQVQVQAGQTSQSKASKNIIIYIVIGIIVAILLGLGIKFYLDHSSSSKGTNSKNEVVAETTLKPTEDPQKVRQEKITTLLNNYATQNSNNISISIYDNKTETYYHSNNSSQRFVAWGFYLPIYIVYSDYPYADSSTLSNVLGKDAVVCNENANRAINHIGGLYMVNDYLTSMYSISVTSYGRTFGQANPVADNYTNSKEAIEFLKILSQRGESWKLSYDIGRFGVKSLADATIYAHLGTEDNSVRRNMNFFGTIKGSKADYCIVILTQNSTSTKINDILYQVHNIFEGK